MESGFGNQTGRWESRFRSVWNTIGGAYRKGAGVTWGDGNRMARGPGGTERSMWQSRDMHTSHLP